MTFTISRMTLRIVIKMLCTRLKIMLSVAILSIKPIMLTVVMLIVRWPEGFGPTDAYCRVLCSLTPHTVISYYNPCFLSNAPSN